MLETGEGEWNCQHILKEDLVKQMPTKLFIPLFIYLVDIYVGHLPGTMFCAMEMAVDKNHPALIECPLRRARPLANEQIHTCKHIR